MSFNHYPKINYGMSGYNDGGGLPVGLAKELNRIADLEIWDTTSSKIVAYEEFNAPDLPEMPKGFNHEGFENTDSPLFEWQNGDEYPLDIDSSRINDLLDEWMEDPPETLTEECVEAVKAFIRERENGDWLWDDMHILTASFFDNAFFLQHYGQSHTFPSDEPSYGYSAVYTAEADALIDAITLQDLQARVTTNV
jgi:hypothetical protein